MPQTTDTHAERARVPLFVDLDGTLLRTDLAQEALLRAVRSPSAIRAVLAGALSGGVSGVKRALAENVGFRADLLPYNAQVLDYVAAARRAGRRVVLATASDRRVARAVADHTGLFDDVIATEPGRNMKGAAKLAAIRAVAGPDGFEYLGDSNADLPIWRAAGWRGFAAVPRRACALAGDGTATLLPAPAAPVWRSLIRAARPRCWIVNALVFLPLPFAGSAADASGVARAALAFAVLSLCAAAVDLVGAMLAAEADRADPAKRERPFAAGDIRPVTGVAAALALMLAGLGIGFAGSGAALGLVLILFLAVGIARALWPPRRASSGLAIRMLLHALRIAAGAVAVQLLP